MKTCFFLSILPPALVLVMFLYAFDQVVFANDLAAPQSVMQTEQNLDDGNVHRGSIEKVEFLNVEGLDKQTIDNVMASAEFQAQVEELRKSGSPLPAMSVLVALFVMGSLSLGGAAGSGRSYVNVPLGRKLSDFFRVDKVPRVVTKTIDVVKKVPVYTTRVVQETLSKVVKIPKQVAYTAYKTVRKVTHKTRTWIETVVRHKHQHPVTQMSNIATFLRDKFYRNAGSFSRSFQRNSRYYLPTPRAYDGLKRDYDDVRSGRKVGSYVHRVNRRLSRERWNLDSTTDRFFKGITDPHLKAQLQKEYNAIANPTYTQRVVRSMREPVVNFVTKAYTAHRTVYESVKKTFTREHTVTDVSYKDVVEQKQVHETVYDTRVIPLEEKIGLALNYVRNLPRIKRSPSNRGFKHVLSGFDRGTLFDGARRRFRNLALALDRAMRDPSAETVKWKAVPVQNYNAFVKEMKTHVYHIRKSEDPMVAMFGKAYTADVVNAEKGIQRYMQMEKDHITKKIDLLEQYATGQISKHYYRTHYDICKEKARKARKNADKLREKIADRKAWYTRKLHDTFDQIDRLAYLKNTKTWREILEKTNITFGIKHISPELAVDSTDSSDIFVQASSGRNSTRVDLGNGVEVQGDVVFKNGKIFTVHYSSQERTKMYEMAKKMAREDFPLGSKEEVLSRADELYEGYILADKILRAQGKPPLISMGSFERTLYSVRNRVFYGERNADNTTAGKAINTVYDTAYFIDAVIAGKYVIKGGAKGVKYITHKVTKGATAVKTLKTIEGTKAIQKAIMEVDLRGAMINGKIEIPKGWNRVKSSDGLGYKYINPSDTSHKIRVATKGMHKGHENYQKPYVVISKKIGKETKFFDLDGNIVSNQYSKEAHPLINLITY